MSSFAWRALRAPAAVALLTVLCAATGGAALALVVLALGAAAIIAFPLFHLHRLDVWARAAPDTDVPEGRGGGGAAGGARPPPRRAPHPPPPRRRNGTD